MAKPADYNDIEGVESTDIAGLMRKDLAPANKALTACTQIGCRMITLQDAEYPDRLRNIYDPPIVIYVRGKLPTIDDEPAVGIVGTRTCTPYGLNAAEKISYRLAQRGILVITGLARGVDSAAARGAMRGGGRVIGVVGSGLDTVYPPENKALFEDVAASGAIISEYPPGSPPIPAHFPARNRIISGLSLGIAVIEAPQKSGALITATRALEQGRDVFALPGNIDAISSDGSNRLLREGAIPILSGDDIVSEYEDLFPDKILQEGAPINKPQNNRKADIISTETSHRSGEAEDEKAQVQDNAVEERDDAAEAQGDLTFEPKGSADMEEADFEGFLGTLEGDERAVAETMGKAAMHIDEIIYRSALPAPQVLTALTMLEIKGHATRQAGLWSLAVRN